MVGHSGEVRGEWGAMVEYGGEIVGGVVVGYNGEVVGVDHSGTQWLGAVVGWGGDCCIVRDSDPLLQEKPLSCYLVTCSAQTSTPLHLQEFISLLIDTCYGQVTLLTSQ